MNIKHCIQKFFVSLFFSHSLIAKSSQLIELPQGLLSSALDPTFVAKFTLFLAVLLLWTVGFGKVCKLLFHMPMIAGQIIGGIVLGPSLINLAGWRFFAAPTYFIDYIKGQTFAIAASDLFLFFILLLSAALTVSYLLWIAGHETDLKDIAHTGLTAMTAGILGAVLPIVMTMGAMYWSGWSLIETAALGLAFSATSVSIPVAMLFAYNKMHLKSSKATLGAAIIDDIFAVILLSLFFITVQSGCLGIVPGLEIPSHCDNVSHALVWLIFAFAVMFMVGYWMIPPILIWFRKHHYSYLIAPFANGMMFIYFAFAEIVGGLAGITGAYFAGLFQRRGDKRHQAEKVFSPYVSAILLPLFLGSIGMQIDVSILNIYEWAIVLLLLVVAIVSKLLACWTATFLSNWFGGRDTHKWSLLEGYIFGSSMVARGEVGLVVATILQGAHVISLHQYVMTVVVIILTTIATPIMLALGFHWLDISPGKKRDEFTLNIGRFKVVGTKQMFNIIMGRIEASGIIQNIGKHE